MATIRSWQTVEKKEEKRKDSDAMETDADREWAAGLLYSDWSALPSGDADPRSKCLYFENGNVWSRQKVRKSLLSRCRVQQQQQLRKKGCRWANMGRGTAGKRIWSSLCARRQLSVQIEYETNPCCVFPVQIWSLDCFDCTCLFSSKQSLFELPSSGWTALRVWSFWLRRFMNLEL